MVYTAERHGPEIRCRDEMEDIEFTVPAASFLGMTTIQEPPAIRWEEALEKAFREPVGCARLSEMARGVGRVAIIVSDSTRGVPTARVLPAVVKELAAAGIGHDRVVVVIATGAHRGATEEEIRQIVGADLAGRLTVVNHDAFQDDGYVYAGTTSYGTPVEVNGTVSGCDLRVSIGKVEPHEFAGFSGGRKSILPGVCSEKTIKINHRPEMMLAHGARFGVLDGNPISEDMVEAARMVGLHFTVNLVLDAAGEAVGIFTGDLIGCHHAAVDFMRDFCEVDVPDRPDIIVTTPGRPLNINLYQAVKPLFVLEDLLSPGGVMILYCSCPDGVGAPDMLLPYEGASGPDEVMSRLREDYEIQMDQALYLCRILKKGIHIIVHSPHVEAGLIRKLLMTPADSLSHALSMAYSLTNSNEKGYPQVMYFPQAQRALPRRER